MSTRTALSASVALSLVVAACANVAVLKPAPDAQPAPEMGGAIATHAGVRVVAEPGAWRGLPTDLDQNVTPLLVHITNDGKQPILVRYPAFGLVTPTGRVYKALPPFQIHGTASETIRPAYGYSGFAVAPYLSRYYPGLVVADPFWGDELYYGTYWPLIVQINLPTGDMVQKALPEGVLSPGGVITGFVYFQKVSPKAKRVQFTMKLRNAKTRDEIGQVTIPFVVK